MNNDMKCPFCQQELFLSSFRMGEEDYQMWNCLRCEFSASRKIWDKIIRTRKALDVAVDALKEIQKEHTGDNGELYSCSRVANEALEQITALEQKES